MNVKITPFLSSLGMVRLAAGSHDSLNCLGEENPRSGLMLSEVGEWKKLCSRIRLTAIFLHLRGTQVVGEQAAYAVGVNLTQFYLWSYKYPEVERLWNADGDPLLASLDPVFELDRFMPKAPSPAVEKAASKKPMPPHERRTVKTIHNLMSRLPVEVRRTIATHFA